MESRAKIRVLIVEDSLVMRRLLVESLSHDAEIEVVGQAADGQSACEKVRQLHPDLVTMDVEMPGMSGIAALREIRQLAPKLPVIMVSSLTRKGGVTVLEALVAGANDYVTKPNDGAEALQTVQRIAEELVPKIKALSQARAFSQSRKESGVVPLAIKPTTAVARPLTFPAALEIVCLGASTGGPNALSDFFKGIPENFPVPIVIVQHMPPMFTKILAERLAKESAIEVFEAEEGMEIVAGSAYVAPGGQHLEVQRRNHRTYAHLQSEAPENSCRPAVDVLFRSVAREFGAHTLAVVMTGMGRDGQTGCDWIRRAGGRVLVQNQETSVVWGMPGAVVEAGLADAVLPLPELASTVGRWIQQSRRS